jgi:hypothetical protein
VLDYVCVSVCGLAPLLGCRPIRVRVSCVSIYCSPPLCNTVSSQHGIRLGFLSSLHHSRQPTQSSQPPFSRHWLPHRRPGRLIHPSRGGPSPQPAAATPQPAAPLALPTSSPMGAAVASEHCGRRREQACGRELSPHSRGRASASTGSRPPAKRGPARPRPGSAGARSNPPAPPRARVQLPGWARRPGWAHRPPRASPSAPPWPWASPPPPWPWIWPLAFFPVVRPWWRGCAWPLARARPRRSWRGKRPDAPAAPSSARLHPHPLLPAPFSAAVPRPDSASATFLCAAAPACSALPGVHAQRPPWPSCAACAPPPPRAAPRGLPARLRSHAQPPGLPARPARAAVLTSAGHLFPGMDTLRSSPLVSASLPV